MKFTSYIKDKINTILAFLIYNIIIFIYTNALQIDKNVIFILFTISCLFFITGFFMAYQRKRKYWQEIETILDNLPEKYLLSEVMKKPRNSQDLAYYKILKRANKSMLENVNQSRKAQKDYKEYIESWVHEIKIPITSAKLLCENHKSELTSKIDDEMEEINNFVEQALFYARLDCVSNDFMIRKVNLEEAIRNVLARNKKSMIQNQMKVEINNIQVEAYTDEKWLEFILNQVIVNSIKYKNSKDSEVLIGIEENAKNVKLWVQDNGIGIKSSELERIFEKGFTGTNGRRQTKSTGIGLYLCQKLCEQLGMGIEAESKENEFTKITITIPREKKIEQ